ncbi:MAG TPA: glycosyltransferase family 4 protein [Syntrophales bacterium]|nr:glycosyltransferase family 4 protein [Syntrophales bacterium]
MKIALMIYGAPDQVSGGYLYDRMMADGLRTAGAQLEVLSLRPAGYLSCLADGFFSGLPEALREQRPDVLLQDELCHPSLLRLNARFRRVLDGPIISVVHHLRSSEARDGRMAGLCRRMEKAYLEGVDGFIFNSRTTRAVLEDLLGGERPSVVACPGGDHVRPAVADGGVRARSRRGPLEILFVGNVIPRKGLHTLVSTLGRLRGEDWHLTVAGSLSADIPYAAQVRGLAAGAGIEDRVAWTGPVSDGRLADLLGTSHCLAVPSFYEGFGIVYLEAMAYGLPVIGSTAGAVPEVVADGVEGFLVAPGDEAALADRIGRFLRDRELLARMGLAARKRYAGHPTWASGAALIHGFLRDMLARKKRTAGP